MRFGDFYTRVCEQLKANYGYRGAVMYLACKPHLMDIIYNEYRNNVAEASPEEIPGFIEATALKIDQEDRAAA